MKTIWVPVKAPIVIAKMNEQKITEVDQSIAFEEKPVAIKQTGFSK